MTENQQRVVSGQVDVAGDNFVSPRFPNEPEVANTVATPAAIGNNTLTDRVGSDANLTNLQGR